MTNAILSIQNFGSAEQSKAICDTINGMTLFHAYLNDDGVPVMKCRIAEVGELLALLAADPRTDWIEYTVQFDA